MTAILFCGGRHV